MKKSFLLESSAASVKSTNRTQPRKEQPFCLDLNTAESLQKTRVHKYPHVYRPKPESERFNNRSIVDDYRFEDSRVLNPSSSQTLSIKKKPLNLSNSFGTSLKTHRDEKQLPTGQSLYKPNPLKWHRRINTYCRDYHQEKLDSHTGEEQKSLNTNESSRRYSFRTVKSDKKPVLVENPFKEQPTAKQLSTNPKSMHLSFNAFQSKYIANQPSRDRKERVESFNDEADRNLKEFLRSKLGIGSVNDENHRGF